MSTDADEQNLKSGGNNRTGHQGDTQNPTLFCHLNDSQKEILLREAGYLSGFFIDSHDGPRRSTRQVARHKSNAQQLSISIQEQNNMITNLLLPKTEREANFAHQGWSVSAMSVTTPWIASRIAKGNKTPREDLWVKKRVVVQRLTVNLTPLDLEPIPEFEGAILAALGKTSKFERGDVIPLTFDLGTSLSITDLKANLEQVSNSNASIGPQDLTAFRTAEISTQGGEANLLPGGDATAWLARTVYPHQWSQVRVSQVAPITDLLKPDIGSQISELYSTLLSYCPPGFRMPVKDQWNFSDGANSLKTISSVNIRSSDFVNALRINYSDGTLTNGWHDKGGESHYFELNNGEHITEVMVWSDLDWVYGIQFVTSNGRVSPQYGGDKGTPAIMSAEDGVLVGCSGCIRTKAISHIQTIWRHDVLKASPSQNGIHFDYIGGHGGRPFNHRGFVNSPETQILSVGIRSKDLICAIQVTYSNSGTGRAAAQPVSWHNSWEGKEDEFQLEPGEYIIKVQGRCTNVIVQLCFITNKGRISKVYGGSEGKEFCCEPPRRPGGNPMRLSYIADKSAGCVDGLLFVWAPTTNGV